MTGNLWLTKISSSGAFPCHMCPYDKQVMVIPLVVSIQPLPQPPQPQQHTSLQCAACRVWWISTWPPGKSYLYFSGQGIWHWQNYPDHVKLMWRFIWGILRMDPDIDSSSFNNALTCWRNIELLHSNENAGHKSMSGTLPPWALLSIWLNTSNNLRIFPRGFFVRSFPPSWFRSLSIMSILPVKKLHIIVRYKHSLIDEEGVHTIPSL